MRRNYQQRSPWATTPVREKLEYHLGFLVDFTWQANEFAKCLVSSASPSPRVTALIDNDLFSCIEICVEEIEKLRHKASEFPNATEFLKCWIAFVDFLITLREKKTTTEDNLALQIFLLLFIASSILKESIDQSESDFKPKKLSLGEADVFLKKTFPVGDAERTIVKAFPYPLFANDWTFREQLESTAQNLKSLSSKID